jgi:hypothetical protein
MVCSSNPAQLLLCILAAACCLAAVNASFERVSVTGTLQAIKNGTLLPVNYWDYNVTGASKNTIYNPKWLNVALNSTTAPIKDSAVEFGFGRIAGPVNITITLDIDASGLAVYGDESDLWHVRCHGRTSERQRERHRRWSHAPDGVQDERGEALSIACFLWQLR